MEPELLSIIELFATAIMALFAYVQNRQKNTVKTESAQVAAFFDPTDTTVTQAPASVPARSYKMNNETKRWVTCGHPPEEQQSLLRQIAEAEAEKKATYTLSVPSAWYEIEYGLIHSSSKESA
jgi:hypothetical protein